MDTAEAFAGLFIVAIVLGIVLVCAVADALGEQR